MKIQPAVLRPKQAAAYIGMSLPSLWRFMREDPTFPRAFKLGANASGILREELDEWLDRKRNASTRLRG